MITTTTNFTPTKEYHNYCSGCGRQNNRENYCKECGTKLYKDTSWGYFNYPLKPYNPYNPYWTIKSIPTTQV